jgi:hypothetical protein
MEPSRPVQPWAIFSWGYQPGCGRVIVVRRRGPVLTWEQRGCIGGLAVTGPRACHRDYHRWPTRYMPFRYGSAWAWLRAKQGSLAAVLDRQWWADAPVNDGLIVRRAPTRRSLNQLCHALTGRRGLLMRPSLLFCGGHSGPRGFGMHRPPVRDKLWTPRAPSPTAHRFSQARYKRYKIEARRHSPDTRYR